MIHTLVFNKHPNSETFFEAHFCAERETIEHSHKDFYEIFVTLKSGIVHYFNGKKETLDDKSVYVVIPGKNRHKFIYNSANGSDYHHYNIAFIKDYFIRAVNSVSPEALNLIDGSGGILKLNLKDSEFEYLTSLITELNAQPNLLSRQSLVRLILTNVCVLIELRYKKKAENLTEFYALDLKEKIDNLEYISKGVVDFYKNYPVAFSGLIKTFKRLTGKTVVDYLMDRRISYAKYLLLSSDYSVLQISQMVGYDSQSYFINLFKRQVGVSPLTYKKQNLITVYGK